MKTIQISEATNLQLDWLVWKCAGGIDAYPKTGSGKAFLKLWNSNTSKYVHPTTEWSQMGPIIERELLEITPQFHSAGYEHPAGKWYWTAFVLGPNNIDENYEQHGPTPLIAAARCYVASKLGETVEVPEELT